MPLGVQVSYIEDNLTKDEKVIYRGKLHWILFASTLMYFLTAVFFIFDGLGFLIRTFNLISVNKSFGFSGLVHDIQMQTGLEAHVLVGISFIVIGAVYLFNRTIKYFTTEIALTNHRVLVKVGFIRMDSIELQLDKVEATVVHQSILGRFLNFGSLAFIGTGGTGGNYKWLAEPLSFHKAVQNQLALD